MLANGVAKRPDVWWDVAFAVDPSCTDRAAVDEALSALASLAAVLEAQRLVCARVLEALSHQPEAELAAALRTTRSDAGTVMRRAATTESAPDLGRALAAGEIGSGHVDRLTGALARLEPAQRGELLQRQGALADVARAASVEDFDRHLRELERRLRTDGGEARLVQQRRAVRLRTWIDRTSGMHCWRLDADPATALRLDARLRSATEALFHGGQIPEGAPSDPFERQAFLQAHGLFGLVLGNDPRLRTGRTEVVVVEDRRVPPGQPSVIDWGLPVDLPASHLDALRAEADVRHVVLHGGTVVDAPGLMDRGRDRRLATADQRRALRALYRSCAIPECSIRFDLCTMHHVVWWQPPFDGPTDLANLLPLCTRHHHHLHDDGWVLHLDDQRLLTVTLPDGSALHGSPNRYPPWQGSGP